MEFTGNCAAVSHQILKRTLFWVSFLPVVLVAVYFFRQSPKQEDHLPSPVTSAKLAGEQPDPQIVPVRATKIAERVVDPDGDSNQEKALRKSLDSFLKKQNAEVGESRLWVGPTPVILDLSVQESSVTINFSAAMASSGTSVFENNFGLIANVVHDVIQGDGIDPIYPTLSILTLVEGQPIHEVFP